MTKQELLAEARAALRREDFEARHGDGESAYNLSQCYAEGFGVPRSLERAVECLELAFELGYAFAANDLFSLYSSRTTPFYNRERAVFIYQEAERSGVRVVRDPEYDPEI